ncbi:WSC domain-containing protein 2-like [Homalodisca vitripennis]|uniref:WSC domain-containing protein 2-like n=1 Tax=Homalodisca vitripennis TaxID=197043 RepID=UPI001EE9F214|nr:WSC domain-containing protein 2-like [Homalodisca vitripennis]
MAAVYLATLLVILAEHASSKEELKYMGCYNMSLVGKRLDGQPKLVQCLDLCRESGNELAAYRTPHFCHCVQKMFKFPAEDDKECSFPCQEDNTKSCGGARTISLYSKTYTNQTHSDLRTEHASNKKKLKYVGCYNMGLVGKRLEGQPKLVQCLDLCRESGNELAAYRTPHFCHCVHKMFEFPAEDDKKCSFRCQEDNTKSCGGARTISLYEYSETYTNDLNAVSHHGSNIIPLILFIGVVTFFISISVLIISLAFCRSRRELRIEHQQLSLS